MRGLPAGDERLPKIESIAPTSQESLAQVRTWFDDKAWPLLKITLPPEPSDEEAVQYLKLLKGYRERREPYCILLDLSRATSFSPRQRKMQADHIREGLPITRIYLKGIAFVAESALKRGMITAIYWLVKPSAPHEIFPTKKEAEAWLRLRLEA